MHAKLGPLLFWALDGRCFSHTARSPRARYGSSSLQLPVVRCSFGVAFETVVSRLASLVLEFGGAI